MKCLSDSQGTLLWSNNLGLTIMGTLVPGVPLLYINHNAIVLDKPSRASHTAAEKVQLKPPLVNNFVVHSIRAQQNPIPAADLGGWGFDGFSRTSIFASISP